MNDNTGALGVHSLDHFSLTVPDLDAAAAFYRGFGLDTRANGADCELRASASDHRWGRVRAGAHKALDYLSFGAYAGDLPALRERLRRRGVVEHAPPAHAVDDSGIWFSDEDGTLLEIRVAEKVSPDRKLTAPNVVAPGGVAAAPLRVDAPRVSPRRLSHVLIFTSDVARAIAFYRETLGLELSDAAADGIAFMHGVHGSDHHMLALAKSDARGFHHCSWDVASLDDVGLGAMQMAELGYTAGWGLGRHVLGSNYFHYVRDPWGSYCEFSYDIDYIPGDGSWTAKHVTPENGFYLWGPQPPADFAFNYESPAANLSRELVGSEPA